MLAEMGMPADGAKIPAAQRRKNAAHGASRAVQIP